MPRHSPSPAAHRNVSFQLRRCFPANPGCGQPRPLRVRVRATHAFRQQDGSSLAPVHAAWNEFHHLTERATPKSFFTRRRRIVSAVVVVVILSVLGFGMFDPNSSGLLEVRIDGFKQAPPVGLCLWHSGI